MDLLEQADGLAAVDISFRGEGYTARADVLKALADVVRAHPDVEVEDLGATPRRQPIWALHVPARKTPRRKVLVVAALHPMEWIATEVAVAFLQDVVAHRRDHVAVTVVALANPDGRMRVEEDLADHRDIYRRGNAAGQDLNRDGAVHHETRSVWAPLLPRRHMATHAPLSQHETRALDALAHRERYDRAASLHSFGGFLYFPWSGRWDRPADWRPFVHLGRAMEAAQGPRAYKTRQLSRWGFFFRAQGSEIDHLYGRYGTLAYLIELTRSGIRPFHLAKDAKTPFRWYNPVDPTRHVTKGVAALTTLVDSDVAHGPPRPPPLPDDQSRTSTAPKKPSQP